MEITKFSKPYNLYNDSLSPDFVISNQFQTESIFLALLSHIISHNIKKCYETATDEISNNLDKPFKPNIDSFLQKTSQLSFL